MKQNCKQENFCREYVVDYNATQAAIRAGYSENAARQQGSRLLTKISIRERITELRNKKTSRAEITAGSIVQRLRGIANASIFDYVVVENEGTARQEIRLKEGVVQSLPKTVKKLHVEPDGTFTIEMHSSLQALEMLAQHIGFFKTEEALKEHLEILLHPMVDAGTMTEQSYTEVIERMCQYKRLGKRFKRKPRKTTQVRLPNNPDRTTT